MLIQLWKHMWILNKKINKLNSNKWICILLLLGILRLKLNLFRYKTCCWLFKFIAIITELLKIITQLLLAVNMNYIHQLRGIFDSNQLGNARQGDFNMPWVRPTVQLPSEQDCVEALVTHWEQTNVQTYIQTHIFGLTAYTYHTTVRIRNLISNWLYWFEHNSSKVHLCSI